MRQTAQEQQPVGGLETELERYRVELTGYCYRMLGSAFETDDAVQETLVRAWRGLGQFDGRAALRTWLYRIATNVCLDMLKSSQRRARPMDLGPSWSGDNPMNAAPLAEHVWLEPIADNRVLPSAGDPADTVVARESIRLAFVAALQHLQPRQRAVLILREVLRWQAAEVAELLETSVAAVNSTLQRARAALDTGRARAADPVRPDDHEQRRLLGRYVEAFERFDVEGLIALLHEEATLSMPPFPFWMSGRADVSLWWRSGGCKCARCASGDSDTCRYPRYLPTIANGSPAFGIYRATGAGGRYEPVGIEIVDLADGRILGICAFLDARLVPRFGLPPWLEPDHPHHRGPVALDRDLWA